MIKKLFKNKKIVYISLSIIFVLLVAILNFIHLSKEVYKDTDKEINTGSGIAFMLETKWNSGIYEMAKESKWPEGYKYNETLSKCENGSTLVWNESTRSISLKANISDKCYVYFDVMPPDVSVTASNIPTTYGALANLSCTNGSATYNQKYQRIEISSINENISCNLDYTTRTSKTYLNSYITSLSGTTQGTGQVVSETAPQDNSTFTPGSILTQNNYSNLSNDATYPFTWDSTNNTWTSTNHTDSKTATMTFNVSASGYYQVCYKQSSEKNYDYAIFYKDNTQIKSLKGISNTSYECVYLGNLTTSNVIKVTYQKDSSASSGTDDVIFYLQSGTYNQKIDTVNAGIRYEGKNPNNYIWFNNELWRIIGVFDSASHGVSGKNLVKIIRADTLDGLAWHKSNTNDWTAASLNKLLNRAYYNAQDGTDSGYCYGYSTSMTMNCDYTQKGIQSGYRGMIANVTWYLGGYSSSSATTEAFYGYERGTTVYSGRPTSTTGYIGLMYPSDYGYSVLASSCARTTNLGSYNSASCGGQSWLYGKGFEWTISPNSSFSSSVWYVYGNGSLTSNIASNGYGHRPVLYLESDVYKIDGDGSMASPYVIGR